MIFNKPILICFPNNGGVKQFSDSLFSHLGSKVIMYQCLNSKLGKLYILKYIFHKNVIFTSNNIYLYLFSLFSLGEITLILHDHKIRLGCNFKERLLLNLFNIFKWRFKKIIIHDDSGIETKKLLLNKNVYFQAMPPHGHPSDKPPPVKIRCNKSSLKLLCFGRLEHYKNFDFFARVISKCEGVELIVAGSGRVSPNLHLIGNKCNNIKIINKFISPEELTSLMLDSDFLVLPYSDITQTGLIELAGYYSKPLLLSRISAFDKIKYQPFSFYLPIESEKSAVEVIDNVKNISKFDYDNMCLSSHEHYQLQLTLWHEYSCALF